MSYLGYLWYLHDDDDDDDDDDNDDDDHDDNNSDRGNGNISGKNRNHHNNNNNIKQQKNTERCRYNAVNFLENPHNRHPVGRPGCNIYGCHTFF